MSTTDHSRRAPNGWLATAIGGTIGGAACGAFAMFTAFAYFDRQAESDLGDLGWVFLWTAVGINIGAAAGAAFLLRTRAYDRPVVSGILFAISVSALLIGWAFFAGQVTHAWDEGLLFFLAFATAIPLAAWGSRALVAGVTRRSTERIRGK